MGRDSPIGVSGGDTKAECTADIEPELLSEFASNGSNGHGCGGGGREMSD